jgi:hypothetical protein
MTMRELLEIHAAPPRDAGAALSLEINRCHRLIEERRKAIAEANNEGLVLFCELGFTRIENELKKAGFALMTGNVEQIKTALAAIKKVK